MPKVKITAKENKGEKVAIVTYEVNGKKGTARAWRTDADKWNVGDEFDAEFEQRDSYDKKSKEAWFKSAPRAKFGGGGKPQRTPEETWSIVAQTCIKAAADLQIALIAADPAQAKGFDINKVTSWADDMFDQAREKVKKAVGA